GVKRSVESLRGKKYYILRKRRLGRVRPSRRATTSKGRGKSRRLRATARCNLSSSDSISCGNVRRWLHDIPEVAPDGFKSQELPLFFLQLMNHIHRVAMDERIDHFPSSGTMCTGSVSKDGLFNTTN
ncbi:hypothetical protein N7539_006019, partial [Penicillium diatomitis]